MADQAKPTEPSANAPMANGEESKPNGTPKADGTPQGQPELSNAEKKKRAKAEKAARRAQDKGPAPAGEGAAGPGSEGSKDGPKNTGAASKDLNRRGSLPKEAKAGPDGKQQHRRTGSTAAQGEKPIPLRRRPSQSQVPEPKLEQKKQVSFFSHLYGQPRRYGIEGTPKDVHPAVLALGVQLSNYVICGSHARGVAMLLALRSFVESYTTPHGTSLPRHLSNHALSPQLSHIRSSRPFSVTQSNSIRWLKNLIATIDPSVPESTAKADITAAIDTYVRERFTLANQAIAASAADTIRDGDVVLTYGKSAVVQLALLAAARRGAAFRAVVVDSRPLFEGRNLARALATAGVPVDYCLVAGLAHAARGATRCLLGAHAVLGNGGVYARAGTALVAMLARERGAPVVVCAETVKFTDRVALDAIVGNELAPEDDLLGVECAGLRDWRDRDNLTLLNLMYDVTPAEYVSMIFTEMGNLPPSSAPAVHRISAGS